MSNCHLTEGAGGSRANSSNSVSMGTKLMWFFKHVQALVNEASDGSWVTKQLLHSKYTSEHRRDSSKDPGKERHFTKISATTQTCQTTRSTFHYKSTLWGEKFSSPVQEPTSSPGINLNCRTEEEQGFRILLNDNSTVCAGMEIHNILPLWSTLNSFSALLNNGDFATLSHLWITSFGN